MGLASLAQGRQATLFAAEIALNATFLDQLRVTLREGKVGPGTADSPEENATHLDRARKGEIKVLLGARSAVFAPFRGWTHGLDERSKRTFFAPPLASASRRVGEWASKLRYPLLLSPTCLLAFFRLLADVWGRRAPAAPRRRGLRLKSRDSAPIPTARVR